VLVVLALVKEHKGLEAPEIALDMGLPALRRGDSLKILGVRQQEH